MSDVITRNPIPLVHAILLSAVYSKFNRAGPKVLNYVQNMARSVRSKPGVSNRWKSMIGKAIDQSISIDKIS